MLLIDTDLLIQGRVKFLNLEIQGKRPWDVVHIRRGSALADLGSLYLSSTSSMGKGRGPCSQENRIKRKLRPPTSWEMPGECPIASPFIAIKRTSLSPFWTQTSGAVNFSAQVTPPADPATTPDWCIEFSGVMIAVLIQRGWRKPLKHEIQWLQTIWTGWMPRWICYGHLGCSCAGLRFPNTRQALSSSPPARGVQARPQPSARCFCSSLIVGAIHPQHFRASRRRRDNRASEETHKGHIGNLIFSLLFY